MQIEINAHADRDQLWEKGIQLGLKDGPLRFFSCTAGQIKLTLDVAPDGKSRITKVNDREVL
jgi:hypothetical protein